MVSSGAWRAMGCFRESFLVGLCQMKPRSFSGVAGGWGELGAGEQRWEEPNSWWSCPIRLLEHAQAGICGLAKSLIFIHLHNLSITQTLSLYSNEVMWTLSASVSLSLCTAFSNWMHVFRTCLLKRPATILNNALFWDLYSVPMFSTHMGGLMCKQCSV